MALNSIARPWQPGLGLALASLLLAPGAWAAGQGSREQMPLAQMPAHYRNECSACHMAYPPGFLPAASWKHTMGALDSHYGSDASLDAATVQSIGQWLAGQAGTYKRAGEITPDHRISTSAWFERKHREVPAAAWKRTSIRSKANCVACHTQAEQGNFDDNAVRIPR
jgi:nitrate/TMAO reductase-like tetraheme cytochrome c subunit